LLFLGRIHEKKGCDLLLKAFAKLAGEVPEVDLVMAGPDQMGMQARLASMVGQLGAGARVHWAGMIGGEFKWGALRSCDALVLPSHQENFGISVVEALSVGRPVLISNQVNIWRQIEQDEVGLVEDDTLLGTENLLRRWFKLAPADRDAMAMRARPCFLNWFNMNRAAKAINELFAPDSTNRKVSV
jgi:glycosyltransferase involved in cell wall biosynthesis